MQIESKPVLFDELARRCPTSKAWLWQQVIEGNIPYLQAGRRRLFNVEAVHAALAVLAAKGEQVGGDS